MTADGLHVALMGCTGDELASAAVDEDAHMSKTVCAVKSVKLASLVHSAECAASWDSTIVVIPASSPALKASYMGDVRIGMPLILVPNGFDVHL